MTFKLISADRKKSDLEFAEDIRLSTLEKYAKAFGKKLKVELVD